MKQFGSDTYETGIALLMTVTSDRASADRKPKPVVQRTDCLERTRSETIKNPNNKNESTFEKELDKVAVL